MNFKNVKIRLMQQTIKHSLKFDMCCCIIACNSCNNKICTTCDNIENCVKCDKSLCNNCSNTFWCYECENEFCYGCEELFRANDGVYCKPCAIKLNID